VNYDELYHTLICSCGEERKILHEFIDNTCVTCEYIHVHIELFFVLDQENHTKICVVCDEEEISNHHYNKTLGNGLCTLCEYEHTSHIGTINSPSSGCLICGAGNESHIHEYVDHYTFNASIHNAYCYCGIFIEQNHRLIVNKRDCICGYLQHLCEYTEYDGLNFREHLGICGACGKTEILDHSGPVDRFTGRLKFCMYCDYFGKIIVRPKSNTIVSKNYQVMSDQSIYHYDIYLLENKALILVECDIIIYEDDFNRLINIQRLSEEKEHHE
jgi:hypothetical protein